jgi:flavin reductase (DIM6/NTAB) family NADH-FMN oxidoreductase RutF
MQIDPTKLNSAAFYPFLTGVVNPRPIAWVTTVSAAGVVNLAPFSFFNAVSANPPVVVFSPALTAAGTKKDTLRNLEASGEFVVNVSVATLAEKINLTSKECLPDESEVTLAGLHTMPGVKVRTPRVTESPAALECVVRQIIPFGSGPSAGNLVIGEVVLLHIDDAMLDATGMVDPHKLQTVGRMGGLWWCRTTDLLELQRPS